MTVHSYQMVLSSHWKSFCHDEYKVYSVGEHDTVRKIFKEILQSNELKKERLVEILQQFNGFFSGIIQGPNLLIAFVDRIASYPVFYRLRSNGADFFSNISCRTIDGDKDLDASLVPQFLAVGYVLGDRTLAKKINKLPAANLFLRSYLYEHAITSYYEYNSANTLLLNRTILKKNLSEVMDLIFEEVVASADGRRIIVPLSGGLDSRFVLSQLVRFGAKNIFAFSYGVPKNWDATIARSIADRLGVSWSFYPTSYSVARRDFQSPERKEFWDYAGNMTVSPNVNAFYALKIMYDKGVFDSDSVFVNGQSGDFITGGHIGLVRDISTEDELVEKILTKHFHHNSALFHSSSRLSFFEQIKKQVASIKCNVLDLPRMYENWEWRNRQGIRVVNGQRAYEFFGASWSLPLWDGRLIDFFSSLDTNLKIGQTLYKEFLKETDRYGIFNSIGTKPSRWPKNNKLILRAGQLQTLLFGRSISNYWYKSLDAYSEYGYLYAPLLKKRLINPLKHVSPIGLMSLRYLNECGFEQILESYGESDN